VIIPYASLAPRLLYASGMSLLIAEIENLSETEAEFFNEGFRMESEGLAQIDEVDTFGEPEPAPGLFRRLFGRGRR